MHAVAIEIPFAIAPYNVHIQSAIGNRTVIPGSMHVSLIMPDNDFSHTRYTNRLGQRHRLMLAGRLFAYKVTLSQVNKV